MGKPATQLGECGCLQMRWENWKMETPGERLGHVTEEGHWVAQIGKWIKMPRDKHRKRKEEGRNCGAMC